MGLLEERSVVVTGSARGLGLAMAERLAAEGASVVISDIDEAALKDAETRLRDSGLSVCAKAANVTDEDAVEALIQHCVSTFGKIDVIVNNAGITRDSVMRKMSLADFRTVVDVHMTGAWLGTKFAAQQMRDQGHGGSIVNISSMSGKVGNVGQTNYSAAKAGLIGLTKASAKEAARYGVRVNAVQPGLIRTAMTDAMPPDVLAAGVSQIPLGRIGEPVDIANAVLFLASDLSAYMTGCTLEVHGGRSM
ncbi:3-oxoacyl-ACP reductase FabG [Nocardioides sp. WS12]|uniref:3-oxoacyl-ACP reductase FabG n=1 Tax=Nocardioides sp. WS12 TaxID=2486272 RepID=UPI0015FAF101|nr:3-oxoacyl-ACP reductase FabG [Nocardioides sp. WS12]